MNRVLLIFIFLPNIILSQSNKRENLFTVFYNVENLFDTINNPITNDESFLPDSKKNWNSEKYNNKLSQLSKVFFEMSNDLNNNILPNIIGLCEVENRLVIDDLLKNSVFNENSYTIVHKESPDSRGIDCAILFDNKFELLDKNFIKIDIPNSKRPTRDIVFVKLKFEKDTFNIFVNHWSSRWGGQKETNYKRVFAAKVLQAFIALNISQSEYTIVMGDFNDYPTNESVKEILVREDFINLMELESISGIGSYNYKGNWDWLDQIILSKNFFESKLKILSSGAYQKEFMLYKKPSQKDDVSNVFPSRTFGGNKWYGGFSDHLPIYSIIKF